MKSSRLKIGILQADSVVPQFQSDHGDYPEMISVLLGEAADRAGVLLEIENFDVEHGVYPAEPEVYDGFVITGSKKSVYDDDPWIADLMAFVRLLHQQKIKLVGICFGHQLIAESLGGKTLGADVGWGVGIHRYEINNPAWFMEPDTNEFSLLVSHKDQVTRLPDGAVLHAGSDFCPNSLYTIDEHILAMQGHPEFSRGYSADLMQWREDILGKDKFEKGMASLANSLSDGQVADWIIRFLNGHDHV